MCSRSALEGSPRPYRMQVTEAACWSFMLFLRSRMLSEDWYTWTQPSSVPSHTELWWASGSTLSRSSRLPRVKEPRLERRRALPSTGPAPRGPPGPKEPDSGRKPGSCSSSELVVSAVTSLELGFSSSGGDKGYYPHPPPPKPWYLSRPQPPLSVSLPATSLPRAFHTCSPSPRPLPQLILSPCSLTAPCYRLLVPAWPFQSRARAWRPNAPRRLHLPYRAIQPVPWPSGPLVSQLLPTLLAASLSVTWSHTTDYTSPSSCESTRGAAPFSGQSTLTAQAGHSLPKLEEMVDRLAWLCRVPEGLGEDSSSESLSKGTNSGRGSASRGPGAPSRPEPAMEMCRQGWGPGSGGVAASSSGVSMSSSGPVGADATSGGLLSNAGGSL